MKNPIESIKKKTQTSARVVDGKLVLSFPEAITPVVWQMDLDQTKASALEVRENKEEGSFVLVLKTPRGETINVAAFQQKADAVQGLMAASHALENAWGQIRPGRVSDTPKQDNKPLAAAPKHIHKEGGSKWIGTIIGIVFILILLSIWNSTSLRAPSSIGGNTQASAGNAQQSTGVPVSADDFLSGR